MRTVAIVQARMGSRRLPGKMMLPLAGEPLIYRLLERVKRCKLIDEIVLATSTKPDCLEMIKKAHSIGVNLYVGSEDDVLDRYYRAAQFCKADIIVRIPGDNPCVEPAEVDRIIRESKPWMPCFASNIQNVRRSGYPDGIGAEVFTFGMLQEAWEMRPSVSYAPKLEHVHLNWYDYDADRKTGNYQIMTVPWPPEFPASHIRLDVNTQADYDRMAAIWADLYPRNPQFNIFDIMGWLDERRQASVVERQVPAGIGSADQHL